MKDVSDTRLLNCNGTWYYRRAVPKHLVAKIGRRMIQHSLHTTDKKTAKKLREIEDVKWSAQFAAAEAAASPPAGAEKTELSERQMFALVRGYVENASKALDAYGSSLSGSDRDEALRNLEEDIAILRDPDDLRADEWIGNVGARLLAKAGCDPPRLMKTTEPSMS